MRSWYALMHSSETATPEDWRVVSGGRGARGDGDGIPWCVVVRGDESGRQVTVVFD